MSFTLRSLQDRHREKSRQNFYRSIIFSALLICVLTLGYYAGKKQSEQNTRQITLSSEEMRKQATQAEQDATSLQEKYQTLLIQYQQLLERYKRDVPSDDLAFLTNLIKGQLEKGMATKRLAEIIRSAQPPQNCSEAISKRFILSTPYYKGPQSAITFADGAITVLGTGEPSINSARNKEAWFDPGKPITMTFHVIGGKKEEKTGLLPLHHTIVVQNREYRFTVSEGPRSFVVVTSDSCDYPESMMQQQALPTITPVVEPSDALIKPIDVAVPTQN